MGHSTYYPAGCCSAGAGSGTNDNGSTDLQPLLRGDLQSSSHEFRDDQSINLATLLAQSGFGNAAIHAVDIDVRETDVGVAFARGGGADILQPGGTRQWTGAVLHDEYRATNDFVLEMKAGDIVVISWSEIVA